MVYPYSIYSVEAEPTKPGWVHPGGFIGTRRHHYYLPPPWKVPWMIGLRRQRGKLHNTTNVEGEREGEGRDIKVMLFLWQQTDLSSSDWFINSYLFTWKIMAFCLVVDFSSLNFMCNTLWLSRFICNTKISLQYNN